MASIPSGYFPAASIFEDGFGTGYIIKYVADDEEEEKDYDEYCEYCQGHYSSKSKYASKNDDGLNFCCLDCADKYKEEDIFTEEFLEDEDEEDDGELRAKLLKQLEENGNDEFSDEEDEGETTPRSVLDSDIVLK